MTNYLKMPKKSHVFALLELGWSYRVSHGNESSRETPCPDHQGRDSRQRTLDLKPPEPEIKGVHRGSGPPTHSVRP